METLYTGRCTDDLRRLRNGWVRAAGRRTRQSSDVAAQSMLRLMAAVESRPPIPTVGEVCESGAVPTAAAAEAARQTLSAPAPPVVAVTNPSPSNVGVPAKAATAAMPRPSPSGAQAEQLPPAHAEPANLAQSSPRARHASAPHAPVWASHCSPAPHATPAHGSPTRGEVTRIRYPVTQIAYLGNFCVKRIKLVYCFNVSHLPLLSAGESADPRILKTEPHGI